MPRGLAVPPREVSRTERLDRPGSGSAHLAQNLADMARLNRLGPARSILRRLVPFFEHAQAGRPLRVLDVGTGGGDLARAIARRARRTGHGVRVIGLDLHLAILQHAARAGRGTPEIRLVAGDALALPVRPGTVDVAVCSLLLHHLPEEGVVHLLRALADTARVGFVVSDLRRGRLAWTVAWLVTRLLSRNPLTRHDGPLSVRRAYTPAEPHRARHPRRRARGAVAADTRVPRRRCLDPHHGPRP